MIRFAVINSDGSIGRIGQCPEELMELQGAVVVEAPAHISEATHGYIDGEFVSVAMLPVDIEQLRAAKNTELNQARLAEENGGCDVIIGAQVWRVQTDIYSKVRISGAVQMASLAQAAQLPFTLEWRMEDNTNVPLDGPGMINLGVAVGYHTAAAFEKSKVLKTQLDAATTAAEINAIVW